MAAAWPPVDEIPWETLSAQELRDLYGCGEPEHVQRARQELDRRKLEELRASPPVAPPPAPPPAPLFRRLGSTWTHDGKAAAAGTDRTDREDD